MHLKVKLNYLFIKKMHLDNFDESVVLVTFLCQKSVVSEGSVYLLLDYYIISPSSTPVHSPIPYVSIIVIFVYKKLIKNIFEAPPPDLYYVLPI